MVNANKVILIGRLTRDPETRFSQSGSPVASFGIAVNRTYKVQGDKREETTFVDLVAFGNTATFVGEYLSKGREIYVEGRLSLNEWTTQDGQKRSKLQVTAENIQPIGAPNNNGGQQQRGSGETEPPF